MKSLSVEFDSRTFVTIVLASEGYPEKYQTGQDINNIDVSGNDLLFHAGTAIEDSRHVVSGGRVLNVVGLGLNLREAIDKAYSFANKIQFKGKYFRKDIGQKGL